MMKRQSFTSVQTLQTHTGSVKSGRAFLVRNGPQAAFFSSTFKSR